MYLPGSGLNDTNFLSPVSSSKEDSDILIFLTNFLIKLQVRVGDIKIIKKQVAC